MGEIHQTSGSRFYKTTVVMTGFCVSSPNPPTPLPDGTRSEQSPGTTTSEGDKRYSRGFSILNLLYGHREKIGSRLVHSETSKGEFSATLT